jgi:PKD repeat protein
MKKLINLAFALLISAAAFAQGYNVEVCVNITGPQPNAPMVASLTYYNSNGVAGTMVDTLMNIQLPYTHCFPSYLQLPDSGFFAFTNGFVQLSSCAPTIVYNYTQGISSNATITVNAQNCNSAPNCAATLTQINGTTILTATGTGVAPLSYSWDGGITFGPNAQFTMNGPGTYCVTIMDGLGCTATDCYTDSSGGACQAGINVVGGGPYILTATGNGVAPLSYSWSTGELSQSIVADSTSLYCLTITDANGCFDTTCVYLTIGNNCNVYITENIVNGINYLTAVADSTFSGTTTFTWAQNGVTIVGANNVQYAPTAPGQYCVTVDYNNTCTVTNCYLYNPGNPVGGCSVVATAIPDSTISNAFTFYTYPTGTPAFSYAWIFSDGTTSTQINPTVIFNNNAGPNWANVTVTDSTGCVSSYCILLPMVPVAGNCNSGFNSFGNYQFGNPGEVYFQSYIQNTNPAGATYSWSFGDGSTSTLENPQHTFTSTGFYNVCLTTTSNGCTYTSCNNEYVDLAWWNNNPFQGYCSAGFMILTNQVNSAGLINIINTSQGNNLFYTWSFGNGFISNNPLPFTTINNPGVYEICVNILDTINNCSDTFCDTITIDSLGNVYRAAMSGNVGILVSGAPQPNALLSVVESEKEMTDITIVPNPTNGIFSLNADWMQGAAIIEIIDITGKLIQTQTINTTKGQKSVLLALQDVADGSYLVRVVSNQRVQTVKLLVNH